MKQWILVAAALALMLGLLFQGLPSSAQEPQRQEAPRLPVQMKSLSASTGFIPPPMDLSHLTGQEMPDSFVFQAPPPPPPSSWDWRTQGKVTPVGDQGGCGACYAFASMGNIESKMLVDNAGTYDFSENNAKECNWHETADINGGTSCSGGNYFITTNLFSKKGTVLESCDPYVGSDVDCKSTCPYQKTLLDWRIICGNVVPSTSVLKAYIQAYGPVYTSIYAGDPGTSWYDEFDSYDGSYTLYYDGPGEPNHAVLIVGWDDTLTHAGGSGGWIVKNSWGTEWGGTCGYGLEKGYFTIAYGSANIGMYSSFIYDWQDYNNSGGIMFYDEGGWSNAVGYGSETAWGLCKFIPSSNTHVTRVEFWTTDVTTDVDVYIYDDFDGTTLSNLLAQKLNNSFSEAGYHSVALDLPLAVTGGDDVIAVVKFTNCSFMYPIPIDVEGSYETERTYSSSNGSTWLDEALYEDDVAIRLRTSTPTTEDFPDITVSPTSFDVTLSPDTTQDYTLTIGNDGSAELTYDISDQETTGSQAQSPIESSLATAKGQTHSQSPDLVLTNSEYDMSIAVSDASSIGRYTEATADEKLLLYGYPYAGTSYMTVRLDGSDYYQDYTMDTYVTQTPTIDGDSITTQWSLPTNVGVSLRLTLQQNTTKYQATVTNNDATSHEVKIRFLLDTMLAYNDGAPFIVPGVGNVTTEQQYPNPVFDYWQATDDLVNPTLTSNCTFDTSNKPYQVQFAYWPDIYDVPFDYTITSGQDITWDTAVGMYWNLGTLSAGEAKDVIFYYGTSEAIIGTPEVSIVTLFTDADSYLPEEDVTIYVDVGNGGDAALVNGNIAVSVQNPEGASVFEDSSAITVEAGAVASQNFTYTLPADAVVGQYTVTANVYDADESLLDEAIATFTVSSSGCSWLDENPKSGTVAAGSSDPVTVTIDTTGLAEGSYSAEIVIASNDPDEASTTVPVTLQVSPVELPTIASVSPNSGAQGETLDVTIDGTNFTGATAVSFGDGITVNSFTVVSATQITADISVSADAALGARDVSVTTPAGTGTLTGGFTVMLPPGASVSIEPQSQTVAPGDSFTIDVMVDAGSYDLRGCEAAVSYDSTAMSTSGAQVTEHNLLGGLDIGPTLEAGTVTYSMASATAVSAVSGSIMTIEFTVSDAATAGIYDLTISAEMRDENNDLISGVVTSDGEVTIGEEKGDFDGDGDIDLADFVEFAAAYGSSTGDPNYDAAGDFDDSGDIGLADFVEFAAVYGT